MRIDADILIPGRGDPITNGSVVLSGSTIDYVGLEPIHSAVAADEVTLNFSATAEMIAVSQTANEITVESTAGETTTFLAPRNELSIHTGGGADTVTIEGLNLDLAGTFSVNDSGPSRMERNESTAVPTRLWMMATSSSSLDAK